MSEESRESRPAWPYTSFKTLNNLIQRFEAEKAIPPRLDRSILGGSEGQKTQVLAAMKFLGLVQGANNEVTPLFQQLVEHPKDRQRLIGELLTKHYPEATRLGTINATAKQLEETFVGLTGDTLRKAVAFYLNAAKFANHKVSKHFKAPSSVGRRTSRKTNGSGAMGIANGANPPSPQPAPPPASASDLKTRYIELLMKKAETASDTLDTSLLDRIEKLLGYETQADQINEDE
jgi:hypothetical protein